MRTYSACATPPPCILPRVAQDVIFTSGECKRNPAVLGACGGSSVPKSQCWRSIPAAAGAYIVLQRGGGQCGMAVARFFRSHARSAAVQPIAAQVAPHSTQCRHTDRPGCARQAALLNSAGNTWKL